MSRAVHDDTSVTGLLTRVVDTRPPDALQRGYRDDQNQLDATAYHVLQYIVLQMQP